MIDNGTTFYSLQNLNIQGKKCCYFSIAGHGKKGFAHPSEAYTLSLALADPQPEDKNLRTYSATLRVPGGNIWTGTLEENRRMAKKAKGGWRLKGDIKKTIWMVPDSVVGKP